LIAMYQGTKRNSDNYDDNSKRPKMSSKVLHVRGLPPYTTEAELIQLVGPFGEVARCFILDQKSQAFIQMRSVDAAAAVLQNLEIQQPTIRSKQVFFQFSSHQEISATTSSRGGGVPMGLGVMEGEPNSTLLISITNVTVPVTLENVVQVCKPYGQVLRVITFTKGVDFQALVQMANAEQAGNARMFLDGKDMFQGCCHLRVTFSKRDNLVVKQNNHKSRDFTINNGMLDQGFAGRFDRFDAPMGMSLGMGLGSPVVLVSRLPADQINTDILFTLCGVYGDVVRVKIL